MSIGSKIAVVVFAALVVFFHRQLVTAIDRFQLQQPTGSSLPSPQAIKLVSFGYEQVLADYFWLSFVNYVGDSVARQKDHYALSAQYLDLVTSLDPSFVQAYWFAAFTVGGDARSPKAAAEIIQRGIEANPDNWYLPYIAGINQYLFADNEFDAAKYYRLAARFPGAPEWLGRQANILESKAPRIIKLADSWLNIYDSAQEPRVKERALEQSIRSWIQVYKVAPPGPAKTRAKDVLTKLGIDIDALSGGR